MHTTICNIIYTIVYNRLAPSVEVDPEPRDLPTHEGAPRERELRASARTRAIVGAEYRLRAGSKIED